MLKTVPLGSRICVTRGCDKRTVPLSHFFFEMGVIQRFKSTIEPYSYDRFYCRFFCK